MKKLVLFFAIILVALNFSSVAYAEDNIAVYLDGIQLDFDVPPTTINDRTMVPMRKIFEAIGTRVDWDEQTQLITVTKSIAENKYSIIKMQVDSKVLNKDGKETVLDVPPVVKDGRTLVPVRAVTEALNAEVQWSDKNNAVVITTGQLHVYKDYPNIPDFGNLTDVKLESDITENGIQKLLYSAPMNLWDSNDLNDYFKKNQNMGYDIEWDDDKNSTLYATMLNQKVPNIIIKLHQGTKKDNNTLQFRLDIEKTKKMFSKDARISFVPESMVDELKSSGWYETFPLSDSELWIHKTLLMRNAIDVEGRDISNYSDLPLWNKIVIKSYDDTKWTKKTLAVRQLDSFAIIFNNKAYQIPSRILAKQGVYFINGVYDYDPKQLYNIDDEKWNKIQNGTIWLGMTKEDFELIVLEQPKDINRNVGSWGVHEQWVYNNENYYFENDILTSWQD